MGDSWWGLGGDWWFLAGGCGGQFQGKLRAFAGAFAVRGESASHFFGGVGAAMQAKAVTKISGGKTVIKDFGEIFRGDANAVVDNNNLHPVRPCDSHAHNDPFDRPVLRLPRALCLSGN